MRIVCDRQEELGIIRVSPRETSTEDFLALDALLSDTDLKAAVIVLDENPRDMLLEDDVEPLVDRLLAATVPIGSVLPSNASGSARRIASAGHFAFQSFEDAKSHLGYITKDRSSRVIRAVMASIQGGLSLPVEDALLRETRIFCELSTLNARVSKERQRP